jgi:hypothetical protein
VKLKEVILCTIGASVLALTGGSASRASAQTAAGGSPAVFQHWNSANEISFTGTIQDVATGHNPDELPGVNLQLDGTTSVQYANLGTQLNSSIKSELVAGQTVTLKGVVSNINGQKVLVVRELTINQQTTKIRNAKGMLSLRVEASAYQGNRSRSNQASNGGAQ